MGADKETEISSAVDNRLEDLFGDANENAGVIEDEATASAVSKGIDALLGDDDSPGIPFQKEPKPKKVRQERKPEPPAEPQDPKKLLLNDLKSVVLSLEWEITDQVMQTLEDEIKHLEDKCKDEKITIAFLQLLSSLGKYIRKKKADAHPDSMGLIRSVFDSLEQIVLTPETSESSKKKMLISEVNKYKELKTQIALKAEGAKKQEFKTSVQEAQEIKEEADIQKPAAGEPSASQEAIIPPFSLADQQGDAQAPSETPYYSTQEEESPYIYGYPGEVNLTDVVRALNEINETIKAEFKSLKEELRILREKR